MEWVSCSPQEEPPFCHQRGVPNKIFQPNATGGHRFPFWGYFSLQWGPVWHRLVLLLEAISWSWSVVPHRKNLPFATREVTQTKYFNCTPPGGHRYPVWGLFCLRTPPKRNGGCEEGSGPIQGDRKFRHPASFPFAMKGSSRKWIPGVPKIKGCFWTPKEKRWVRGRFWSNPR